MTTLHQQRQNLFSRFEQGKISAGAMEDALFEIERTPQGRAECPDCGGEQVYFREHICGWTCPDCGNNFATSSIPRIIEAPEGW